MVGLLKLFVTLNTLKSNINTVAPTTWKLGKCWEIYSRNILDVLTQIFVIYD